MASSRTRTSTPARQLENTTIGGWHNLLRYGIARKREQAAYFGDSGNFLTFPYPFPYPGGPTTYSGYFGNIVVTFRGANGYTTTRSGCSFTPRTATRTPIATSSTYGSDYHLPKHHIAALFGFRYENERGSFEHPGVFGESEAYPAHQFSSSIFSFGGDLKQPAVLLGLVDRLQKNHLYGIAGTPRIGLAWIAVRPDARRYFRGTRLRANAATGVQEPSLAAEFSSLYTTLLALGDTADIAAYRVTPLGPQRSRTFDVGMDQSVLGDKLLLKAGYFHNQFSHQLEYVGSGDLQTYFGFTPDANAVDFFYGAELNSQAFRAQGMEAEVQYQPLSHVFFRGGYTYLATLVEQSFSSDATAARGGYPSTNPNFPEIPIGANSPFIGNRVFRRPPHTAYFAVQYTGQRWSAALKGAIASRSDDTTFLGGDDPQYGNTLLLPNQNLDFGYTKLDLYGTYAASRHVNDLYGALEPSE